MDTDWRPMQGSNPDPNTPDWRAQLQPEAQLYRQ
jgi:hypothetical protein